MKNDCYKALTHAFCDGFEISLNDVPKKLAETGKLALLDQI